MSRLSDVIEKAKDVYNDYDTALAGITAIVICGAIALGFVAFVYWILWVLWCAVLGYFFPTGPEQLINPDYWYFVLGLLLVTFMSRLIFGERRKNNG